MIVGNGGGSEGIAIVCEGVKANDEHKRARAETAMRVSGGEGPVAHASTTALQIDRVLSAASML